MLRIFSLNFIFNARNFFMIKFLTPLSISVKIDFVLQRLILQGVDEKRMTRFVASSVIFLSIKRYLNRKGEGDKIITSPLQGRRYGSNARSSLSA